MRPADAPSLRLVKADANDLYDPLGAPRAPLQQNDPRIVFAAAVAACMEGGKAALLRVEHRNKLRTYERAQAARDYYRVRDDAKVERTTRNFIETVDGEIAEL